MKTQISRDPFARTALMRETIKTSQSCKWCGQHRRGHSAMFYYFIENDSGRRGQAHGPFCSKACHDSFHS